MPDGNMSLEDAEAGALRLDALDRAYRLAAVGADPLIAWNGYGYLESACHRAGLRTVAMAAAGEAPGLRAALADIHRHDAVRCQGDCECTWCNDARRAALALATPPSAWAARVTELLEAAAEVEGLRPIMRGGDADGIRTMGLGLDRLRDAAAELLKGGAADA